MNHNISNIIDSDYELFKNNNHKIAIVASKFNSLIVDNLISGCIETLNLYSITKDNISLVKVPGAMELPLAVQTIAKNKDNLNISGVVVLGAVIRGATPHFEHVSNQCMSGLSKISLEYDLPMGNGVLTTDTIEQALERAGLKAGNKGSDAALAVLNMISVISKIENKL